MGRNPDKLECDLVMRGGITSGIVYPRAIAKLAETYNFRSIGGTSAGGHRSRRDGGSPIWHQQRRRSLSDHLRASEKARRAEGRQVHAGAAVPATARHKPSFQPAHVGPQTGGHIQKDPPRRCDGTRKLLVLFRCRCGSHSHPSPLGGKRHWAQRVTRAVLIIAALVLGLMTAILGAALGVFLDVRKRLPENRYGLCSGSSDMRPDRAGVLPLTDWLHDFFQNLAGSTPTDDPVTFGDLWGNGGDENAPRDIELVLMTTNVTRGISHRFPFLEGSWGQLYFDKGEFDALFPKSVVDWMVKHAAGIRHGDRLEVPKGFHPIPKPSDLPILLGARMSLSFPVLLSRTALRGEFRART